MVGEAERREVECRDCGAILGFDPSQRTATCTYCRSPSVIERPASADRPRPSYIVPFVLSQEVAAERVRAWQKHLGFFRTSILKKAPVSEVWGVYLPTILYSAVSQSAFRASIGENYTVGSGDTQRTVTEWRPLTGHHSGYVRDVLVSASRVISNLELAGVEPYDLRALHRYTGALLAGWAAEEPVPIGNSIWDEARKEALANVSTTLSGFMPGDTHNQILHRTALSWEFADLVLVPVWVLVVRYDEKRPPARLLVNGQTGYFSIDAALSWSRVALVVCLGVLAVFVIVIGLAVLFALLITVGS